MHLPSGFISRLFLKEQPCNDPWVFGLRNQRTMQTEAAFILYEKGDTAESPCRAPFGSIEFNPKLPRLPSTC